MHILRIEHPVAKFDAWKAAFDQDPIGRQKSGVRRHRVFRSTDDPNFVMVELEFRTSGEAEAVLAGLRKLWGRVDVMHDPKARIFELLENKEY